MLDTARDLADQLLAPAAETVDASDVIPRTHLDALASAGLFGLVGPVEFGGADAEALTSRRVLATIAGGCGATFFVWAQHHGVVQAVRRARALVGAGGGRSGDDLVRRAVTTSGNGAIADQSGGLPSERLDELLGDLCAGRTIAGTAFAYLRNPHAPGVRARRVEDGWEIDGVAPWVTSWGIAQCFLVAATTEDGRIVWVLLDAGPDRPHQGLEATRLPLVVFGATGTVSARFDGCRVDDCDVLFIEDLGRWRQVNRIRAAIGQPQCLGVAERCAEHLRRVGDDDAVAAAERLDASIDARWSDDRALTEEMTAMLAGGSARSSDADAFVGAASEHRARCLEIGRAGSTLFVAATGGRGMALAHPAQRLVREAAFFVIQAMTDDGRHAALQLSDVGLDTVRHHDSAPPAPVRAR